MNGDYPRDTEERLGVSAAMLRTALAPLQTHISIQDNRHTAAHPSRDMRHLLSWDLDRIKARGALEDLAPHRTLVACATAAPFSHHVGVHNECISAVERDKRAPPVIFVEDSEDEDGEVKVVGSSARASPATESLTLEEGEIADLNELEAEELKMNCRPTKRRRV